MSDPVVADITAFERANDPDGAFYVGTLAEGAGNGGADVWRMVPGQAPEVSRRGRVYVANWSVLPTAGGPAPLPPDAPGQVVRLRA